MDFDVGGVPRVQNRPKAVTIIDFDVCDLAMEGTGLKTRPGFVKASILTSAALLWRAPGSKQSPEG